MRRARGLRLCVAMDWQGHVRWRLASRGYVLGTAGPATFLVGEATYGDAASIVPVGHLNRLSAFPESSPLDGT